MEDLTNKRFGRLTVIRHVGVDKYYNHRWECKCDCGNVKTIHGNALLHGKTVSCGCFAKDEDFKRKLQDVTGIKFNMLTVIKFIKTRNKHSYWECLCDCGNIKVVTGNSLKKGTTKSCGCYNRKNTSDRMLNDLTGNVFGRLTIMERVGSDSNRAATWRCKCSCGNEVVLSTGCLTRETRPTRSCGCLIRDANKIEWGVATLNELLNGYTNNARRRKLEFNLSREEFIEIISKDCHYCGIHPAQVIISKSSNGDTYYNGIDRKDNSRGYTVDNVVPSCFKCNSAKRTLSYAEFVSKLKSSKAQLSLVNFI